MAEYGIPYMGSKASICNDIIKIFPKAENFYDLFGGGFSITHAMLLRRKKDYQHFHFNELRPGICELVKKAINGEFNYNVFKPPFVSRDEFFAKLEKDAYIKCIWSFGNNGRTYIFSKEIEPYKKSMHNAIVFNQFDELAKNVFEMDCFKEGFSITDKRLFLRNKIEQFRRTKIPEYLHKYLNEKQLRQLQQLSFYNSSYESVQIKENAVIYCDPPYAGTADYGNAFNTKKFLDWADNQNQPVFISEYNIPDKRFRLVFKIGKRSMLSAVKTNLIKEEKLYVNKAGYSALINRKFKLLTQ
jgi:site-specific DNA-adenine methylase